MLTQTLFGVYVFVKHAQGKKTNPNILTKMYGTFNFNTIPSLERYFCCCETKLLMQIFGVHFYAGSEFYTLGSCQIKEMLKTLPGRLILFLFFVGFFPLNAQRTDGLLIRMNDNQSPETVISRWERSAQPVAIIEKKISKSLNIWLLKPVAVRDGTAELLQWLRAQPEVRTAQFNHILAERNILPDDPLFPLQWQLQNTGQSGGTAGADAGAPAAWDITTGGLTPAGDTIVVAVIDGGVAAAHPDIAQNMWRNRGEIPGDGIDNDSNGYVDDFKGWNVWTQNDQIQGSSTSHGTPVSGIIGAKGNNNTGVTGINWNVKIMFVAGGGTEGAILEAYDYIHESRQRYNQTYGQQGAFVVAVNCSWGTDYGNPDDAPLWCEAFDEMGQAGILSVASTANIPVDVDEAGDLPTTCPSDYLITVTNLDHNNEKAANAAWGAQNIDLGAYGKNVFTVAAGNTYDVFSGTSFAAPQVSGAVGLLYASPCPNLIALAKSNPAAAALWAKSLMMESVAPAAALEGITVSGGALQLHQLLQTYENQCAACPAPFNLYASVLNEHAARLSWIGIAGFQTIKLRWRLQGSGTWTEVEDVQSPYLLDGLDACSSYEFALAAYCNAAAAWSDWSVPFVFVSEGCCTPPDPVVIGQITATGCVVSWENILAGNSYRLRLREMNTSGWEEWETVDTIFTLSDLLPCTAYELQMQTACDTGTTAYGASVFFQTQGCGSCLDANYCPSASGQSMYEWIENVSIGSWTHDSGSAGSGYQNFTGNLEQVLQIYPQNLLPVTITPAFAGLPYKEFFRIFIDYNMDGVFNLAEELAFDPGFAHDGVMEGQIIAPAFTAQGLTRMRVMMKYKSLTNTLPLPCESYDYGQVEDYCVELMSEVTPSSVTPRTPMELHIYPQPVHDFVRLSFPEHTSGEWNWTVSDLGGRVVLSGTEELSRFQDIMIPAGNWLPGMYVITARQGQFLFRGKVVKI